MEHLNTYQRCIDRISVSRSRFPFPKTYASHIISSFLFCKHKHRPMFIHPFQNTVRFCAKIKTDERKENSPKQL